MDKLYLRQSNNASFDMWKKKTSEKLPWYRAKSYRGNLTETQKRLLDSFRSSENHPAATYSSLPTEVQNYINRLELEAYDHRQHSLVASCAFISFMGVISLYREFWISPNPTVLNVVVGISLIVIPWIYYPIKWKKNSRDFLPDEDPSSPTDEALRMEWEIEYLSSVKYSDKGRNNNPSR